MDIQNLVKMVLILSILLTVISLGMRATPKDATFVLRHPGLLVRSLLSMYGVMFVLAILAAKFLDVDPSVKMALVALAVAPVPPVLPAKIFKAGGAQDYTIGLLVAASVCSIILAPLAMILAGRLFDLPLEMTPGGVAKIVLSIILAPLALGILFRKFFPSLAEKIGAPLSTIATIMLIVGLLPVLFVMHGPMLALIGNGTLIAYTAFAVLGLIAGHLIAGSAPGRGVVLGFCTSCRHPGVAFALFTANFPGEEKTAFTAILLYLLVSFIITSIYVAMSKRTKAGISEKAARPRESGGPGGLRPA